MLLAAKAHSRRRRSWFRFALGVVLVSGLFAGCVAWVLPDGQFAGGERMGGVGEALDEALRQGDAASLMAHVRRTPGTRVCFVWEFNSLRYPALWNYWRTYGLPNMQVPDAHWAVAVLRAGRPPEFVVVRTQTLILTGDLGCVEAERLRLDIENRGSSPPLLLHLSTQP